MYFPSFRIIYTAKPKFQVLNGWYSTALKCRFLILLCNNEPNSNYSRREYNIWDRQVCAMSLPTALLQVWGKNVILTNLFGAKIWWENWWQYEGGGVEAPLGGPCLPMWCACGPPLREGEAQVGQEKRCGKWGYHCRWRAGMSYNTLSQICGSWYLPRFLYGPGDTLGLPIHYGKIIQLDGMTCDVSMVINGGLLNVPCICSQKSYPPHQCTPLYIQDGHTYSCIFTVSLDSHFITDTLKSFTKALWVRDQQLDDLGLLSFSLCVLELSVTFLNDPVESPIWFVVCERPQSFGL